MKDSSVVSTTSFRVESVVDKKDEAELIMISESDSLGDEEESESSYSLDDSHDTEVSKLHKHECGFQDSQGKKEDSDEENVKLTSSKSLNAINSNKRTSST